MPHDLVLKSMNALHKGILLVSGGRFGWEAANMPVLELVTTGRKSGEPRSVMLTSPLQQGSTIVVVASRGGDDHHPAWFLNLRNNPAVQVAYKGGPKKPMKARQATPAERTEMWPKVVATYKGYGQYQSNTEREIPLVLLEPSD